MNNFRLLGGLVTDYRTDKLILDCRVTLATEKSLIFRDCDGDR